mgnify:CR=1 FL=1
MKNIGIIVAMQEELEEIKKYVEEPQEKEIKHITFIEGKIAGKKVVLVQCGIGKVNSAMATQILIDYFDIEYVVNIGVAGALNPFINIGDVIIADKLIQHDFDITAFGHSKGYITGVGDFIYSDKTLVNKIQKLSDNNKNREYKIEIGTIASGDIFCTDISMKNKIPFIVMRSISDSPNGENEITFNEFLEIASKRIAELLYEYIKSN